MLRESQDLACTWRLSRFACQRFDAAADTRARPAISILLRENKRAPSGKSGGSCYQNWFAAIYDDSVAGDSDKAICREFATTMYLLALLRLVVGLLPTTNATAKSARTSGDMATCRRRAIRPDRADGGPA